MIAIPSLRGCLSSGFTPLSLSPALWLSDTGSDPAVWPDLSGNGRDATQATAGYQPAIVAGALNGRQVRRFAGSAFAGDISHGNGLTVPDFGQHEWTSATIFVVLKSAATNVGAAYELRGDTYSGNHHGAWDLVYDSFGQTVRQSIADPGFTAAYGIFDVTAESDSNTWRWNGEPFKSNNSTFHLNASSWLVGSSYSPVLNGYGYTGDIAELLVFPTALSDTNRQRVEQDLASKWGITLA